MLIYMIMGLFGTDRYPINFLLLVDGLFIRTPIQEADLTVHVLAG